MLYSLFAVLQKHYKVIEALALDYDEVPEVQDQIRMSLHFKSSNSAIKI